MNETTVVRGATIAGLVMMIAAQSGIAQTPAPRPPATPRPSTPGAPAGTKAAGTKAPGESTPASNPDLRRKPITLSVFSSGVYDSNIGRVLVNAQASNGFVYGAGIRYQEPVAKPRFGIVYEVAKHAYTHSEQFDRVSHHINGIYSQSLARWLNLEAIGDIGIRGSSEDRDVGNNYTFIPRINFRLNRLTRFRAYGAYRLRRYDVDSTRNATNRYAGIELRRDARSGLRAEAGARYETNDAISDRRSYTRRTYYTLIYKPLTWRDDFIGQFRYRSQHYDKRLIRVNNALVPRHDDRFAPTFDFVHRFGAGFSLDVNYDFESRVSNDPDIGYRDHVLTLTGRVDW